MWKVKVSLYEEWFYMWIQADSVEAVGINQLLLDGCKTIKMQGNIDSVEREI